MVPDAAPAGHEQLVQALLHGDALPALPDGRTLVQTHISSLVLAGDFAYKLRRPLRLPFLDFSTAALRRDDCLRELRLNRRTAPQLYLDVLPVFGTPDAPRLGPPTDPQANKPEAAAPQAFDWLLRMRRFDQADLLDSMAHAGRLGEAHIDALAQQVAAFHDSLPPSPPAFGAPETAQRWLLEALASLAACPAAEPQAARIEALRAWCTGEFERVAPVLAQRRAQGFVRECHGDLHLANIVLYHGVPRPFDGIEFNSELRHIDVVNDIAFTFMDLIRHGLPQLGWRLVGAYAERTGDHAGLVVLRYFAVYRALVRARVALMRATHAGPGAARAAIDAFEHDLALAERLAAPRRDAPRLVLVCGLSGSGKSTVAQWLAPALGGVRLRSDVERKRLHGLAPTARPAAGQVATLYAADATRRTYDRLGTLARTLLRAGIDAVVDAAALRYDERDALRSLSADEVARFVIVECTATDTLLRERIARRRQANRDASDADAAVLDLQHRVREPLSPQEGALELATDGDRSALARRCEALAAQIASPADSIDFTPNPAARP